MDMLASRADTGGTMSLRGVEEQRPNVIPFTA